MRAALALRSLRRQARALAAAALSALVSALGASPAAAAGTPIPLEVACPLTGETFTVTGTNSCTILGSRMTLRRVTSCDFVTALPVCPGSGLPMYRTFTAEEVVRLKRIVDGDAAYAAALDRSRFFRAAIVEAALGGDPTSRLNLLVRGLGYPKGIDDPAYRAAFLETADTALPNFPAATRPFLQALVAFVLIHDGRAAEAAAALTEAAAAPVRNKVLGRYIEAIRACLEDRLSPTCAPGAAIPN